MTDASLHLPPAFLNEAFSKRSGVPLDHFELYYRGKRLEGEAALASWGVGKGATIEVKMRGRGGMPVGENAGSGNPVAVGGGAADGAGGGAGIGGAGGGGSSEGGNEETTLPVTEGPVEVGPAVGPTDPEVTLTAAEAARAAMAVAVAMDVAEDAHAAVEGQGGQGGRLWSGAALALSGLIWGAAVQPAPQQGPMPSEVAATEKVEATQLKVVPQLTTPWPPGALQARCNQYVGGLRCSHEVRSRSLVHNIQSDVYDYRRTRDRHNHSRQSQLQPRHRPRRRRTLGQSCRHRRTQRQLRQS